MTENKAAEEAEVPETINKDHHDILPTIPDSWMLR